MLSLEELAAGMADWVWSLPLFLMLALDLAAKRLAHDPGEEPG